MARPKHVADGRSLAERADALVAAGLITRRHATTLVQRREERVIADWERRLRPETKTDEAHAGQMALLEV